MTLHQNEIMSKVIEIIDSDEETSQQTHQIQKTSNKDAIKPVKAEPSAETPTTTTAIDHRHRQRKSQHAVRSSPDIQFEIISVDEDSNSKKSGKNHKSKSKQPGAGDKVNEIIENYMKSEENNSLLMKIAEERARINFMLGSYGMPEINFSLNTHPDMLKFQLENRLKQHDMRNTAEEAKRKPTTERNSGITTGN